MSVALREVSRSHGSVKVLPSLSLDIGSGELVALLGPSGCGKTTILRLIAGLDRPDSGTVSIDGTDVTGVAPEKRRLGMVFQQYAVWPHRTVGQNVAYPLERAGVGKEEIGTRVAEALELVQLGSFGERRPHQLSGGQLQRVALARALVAHPRVLLLDEPLSNLDASLREEMRAEIRSLQRRMAITTVLVTHDQQEALSIADRVVVLKAGRVEQIGVPGEIYRSPATAFVATFVGANVLAGSCDGSRIRAGAFEFAVPAGMANGAVSVVVRPEEIRLDPAGVELFVKERLYLGDRVELRLQGENGSLLRALVSAREAEPVAAGSKARFSVTRTHVLPG